MLRFRSYVLVFAIVSKLFFVASMVEAAPLVDSSTVAETAFADTASTATSSVSEQANIPTSTYDVTVRSTTIKRSASDVVRDRRVLEAAPHRSADELLFVVPGIFITQHSGEGKAFQIFYRGFDAVHGQDLEIWAGGAPVNDVSNIHGQGYADLHFLPVEIVREVRAMPGTYDPHQGDFAVAGSLHFDLGSDKPGLFAKAEGGMFGVRRLFLSYRPKDRDESTFGAVEIYHTNGFGPSRAADRAAAVAQWQEPLGDNYTFRLLTSAYSTHFASAGVLLLSDVEKGTVDRYATYDPTQGGSSSRAQAVIEFQHRDDIADWSLSTYLVFRKFRLRENFTGYLKDVNGDSEQQLSDAVVVGAKGSYRLKFEIFSPRDAIEIGFFARTDFIDQSQRRLSVVDGTVTADEVDASVFGSNIAGFIDLALRPMKLVVLRGGVRVDGLGYAAEDNGAQAQGQARSSQGTHVGAKGTVDVTLMSGLHGLLSYGDGFRSPQARSLADGERTPFTSVRSVELGFALSLDHVKASVSAFRTTLSDDLVFDQSTNRNERVPSTRRLGLSANVDLPEWKGLTAALSATFTHASFTRSNEDYSAGDLVPYAPQVVSRLDVSYSIPIAEVFGEPWSLRFGSAASLLARRPLPFKEMGHEIFLLDALIDFDAGPVEVGLDAFNLLDAKWYDGEFVFATRWRPEEASALVPQRLVTVGAPRTLLLSVSLHL